MTRVTGVRRRLDVAGLRIDSMSRARGVAPFEELWERRPEIEADGEPSICLGWRT